jgi:hypothetical protein
MQALAMASAAMSPYAIGKQACKLGASLSANPFSPSKNLRAWVQWSFGFTDAEGNNSQATEYDRLRRGLCADLRKAGHTWGEIAELLGYKSAQHVRIDWLRSKK